MKALRLFVTVAVIGLSMSALQAEVFLNEPFDYDPATYSYLDDANSGNTPWGYGGVQSASMTNGNLSWPGYRDSGSGYKVHVINIAGYTTRADVGWNGTNGFRYDAVLVKFDDITNLKSDWVVDSGGNITSDSFDEHKFISGCGFSSIRGSLLVKKDTNDTSKINFGVADYRSWGHIPEWGTNSYDGTQTHLIVMRFAPEVGHVGYPVELKLYVDPEVTADEPVTPEVDAKYRGNTGKSFILFGNKDVNFEVDEWTAAPTWRELFPLPEGTMISVK